MSTPLPITFAELATGLNPMSLFDQQFAAATNGASIQDNTIPTLAIAATGVTAGTYGSAVSIPQITVNAKGQVTAVSGQSITGAGKKRFILTSGQSNATYRLAYAWTPPPNLYLWDFDGTIDPATKVGTQWLVPDGTTISIALAMAAQEAWANPDTTVYVFQIAKGGLAISYWLPGTPDPDMYACIQANVAAGLALVGGTQIDVLQWWQGESDAAAPTNYVTNFATLMARFRAESWFAYETPVIVHGITVLAIAPFPAFNAYLEACISDDPDYLRYVFTGALPVEFWDPAGTDYLHMFADGYYAAGMMAWQAWRSGLGRASVQGMVVDPTTGKVLFGPTGVPSTQQLLVKNDQAASTVFEVDNQSASSSARAYMGVKSNAGSLFFQAYPLASGGGIGSNGWTGASAWQFVVTNAAGYFAWYTSGATLRATLAANGNFGVGATTPDRRIHSEVDDASNNTVTQALRLTHTTSGTPGAGIGVGMEFEAETSAANNEVGMAINAVVTDATAGSEDFDFVVNLMTAGATASEKLRVAGATSLTTLTGSLSRGVPVTKTANFTVADTENWLINNKAGSACVVTLPAAASYPGREIMIKTIQAQTTDSNASNVVPITGGAAGTAILSANAGRWATLVSNGTNWEIMQGVI